MKNPFESFKRHEPEEGKDGIDEVIEASKDYEKLRRIDQAIIDNAEKSVNEGMVLPPGYSERIEQLKDKNISEAANWNELFAILAVKEEIIMGGMPHGAARVIELIEAVRRGDGDLNTITRTEGLREKVAELLEKEQ